MPSPIFIAVGFCVLHVCGHAVVAAEDLHALVTLHLVKHLGRSPLILFLKKFARDSPELHYKTFTQKLYATWLRIHGPLHRSTGRELLTFIVLSMARVPLNYINQMREDHNATLQRSDASIA